MARAVKYLFWLNTMLAKIGSYAMQPQPTLMQSDEEYQGKFPVFSLSFMLMLLLTLPVFARPTVIRHEAGRWIVENEKLRVMVDPAPGRIAVLDRTSSHEWRQPDAQESAAARAGARFRHVRRVPGGIAFEADFGSTKGKPNAVTVSLRVPDSAADLSIVADVTDMTAEHGDFPFLEPFLPETPKSVLAVADYCDGHLYPLDMDPFPRTWFGGDRLDMPWVGVCDLEKGYGYALILETSDNAWVQCRPCSIGTRRVYAPQVGWLSSKGTFGYPRRLLYRFAPAGGYVALAKAYRAYAKAHGLLVPFSEKLKRNPNIRRLFGAPDVWGDASLKFAREAKAAGVEKMLIHGRTTAQEMKEINALGYLTSEYDNYTDILPVEPGKKPDSSHDLLPDHAVLNADGKRMAAWLTYDKKTQYMKRCPSFWVPTARLVIPKVLQTWPFIGRFIDVTTAEGLYECYDPNHPLTKPQKRECGEKLLAYVRSNRLVVGGEHGIWWGVPHQDYIEGMMSGNRFGWPAGHLIHPKSREEKFAGPYGTDTWENYDRWSMGHEWRAPLWELVFHDCVVSTWYWGDSNDYLLDADPGNQAKKDAFNVLYGTMPMLWANAEGSWRKDRAAFLRTYRNICRLHKVVAEAEMLSHEFLTPDHAVQRTRFSDGTTCVVNFGAKPQRVMLAGKSYLLPQNGWAVKGPKIEQSRAIINGIITTTVRQPGYISYEEGDHPVTARALGRNRIQVQTEGGWKFFHLEPQDIVADWDIATTRAFALDQHGRRIRQIFFRRFGRDLRLMGGHKTARFDFVFETANFEVVCRSEAKAADLLFDEPLTINPPQPKQGQRIQVTAIAANRGGRVVQDVQIALYADAVDPARKLADRTISLAPGAAQTIAFTVDTAPLDGPRRLLVVATPLKGTAELCGRNNTAARDIQISPDFDRWPHRKRLRVEAGAVDRENETVVFLARLSDVEPSSMRVAECDAHGKPQRLVPAKYEIGPDGIWIIPFAIPGRMPAGSSRRFILLYAQIGGPRFLPPGGSMWNDETKTITSATYRARFENGMLVDIGPKEGKPFISRMIYSSAETGWTEEPGTVQRFEVREDGPVRTIIYVRKALRAGVISDKFYVFYADHFELQGSVNKQAGVISRAYYLRPGQYEDSGGFRAKVDGQGDAEDVSGRAQNPKWYAVYADDWAEACIALSPMSGITYWDNPGAWGGIGFNAEGTKGIRVVYVFHPGTKDARYAEQDYRRLTSLVVVKEEK
jgi:hypothetical protein